MILQLIRLLLFENALNYLVMIDVDIFNQLLT